jgi:hypothetical protein
MTEAELLKEVMGLCKVIGLLTHHCGDSRRCQGMPGLPDLVIVGKQGFIWAELKDDDEPTTPEQDLWLWTLAKAGMPWYIWRPEQWRDGTIEQILWGMA